MPYCKGLGICLMLSAGFLLGAWLLAFERRRVRQAEGLLQLLRTVRMQIDCFSAPIPGILEGLSAELLTDCGITERARELPRLFAGAQLYQSTEICRMLGDFAAQLGRGSREEQLRCCDYFLARLMPYCERMRADLPQKEKIALLLATAAAVLPVLLLL